MNKTLALLRKGFESSAYKTPEFEAFCRTFRNEFSKELKSIGATDRTFRIGHFEIFGNYTINNQPFYFSLSDVRFFPEAQLLYRTCKDYSDYSGGYNRYVKIETGMAKKMSTGSFKMIDSE